MVIASAHGRSGWERRSLSRLGHTLIDGAIVVPPSTLITDQAGIPVVAIDPHTGPDGPPTVDADNVAGARSAVEHLLDLRHTRIGFLGGRPTSARPRCAKTASARHSERPASPRTPRMRVGGHHPDLADAPAHELLSLPADRRPTAVFAANDLTGIRVVEVARELGLVVPQDLELFAGRGVEQHVRMPTALTIRSSTAAPR